MSAAEDQDRRWMRRALREARRGIGLTSPNPPVGAVIVGKDGTVLASGWHHRAGDVHAEIDALRKIPAAQGGRLKSATLYVTLEPCSTHGKTPPCTEALCTAGLKRVVWAMDDPNPRHAGRAAEMLAAAGIAVISGICQDEAARLLAPWRKFTTTGLPWVVAKAGVSVDGRMTRPEGEGQWLTNDRSRRDAMQLRLHADAILVGGETVRTDNPRLNLRGIRIPKEKQASWRVVWTKSGNLPPGCHLLTDELRERTLIMQCKPLEQVLRELAAMGVVSVLVEGGGTVLAAAFSAGLVDEFHAYVAPLITGGGVPVVDPTAFGSGASIPLKLAGTRRIGDDVKLSYRRQ